MPVDTELAARVVCLEEALKISNEAIDCLAMIAAGGQNINRLGRLVGNPAGSRLLELLPAMRNQNAEGPYAATAR